MTYLYKVARALVQKKVAKNAHYIKGKTLDAGAGDYGRYHHHFKNAEIVTMDVSPSAGVQVVASMDNMPFDDESFDSVLSTYVLEHVEFPEQCAKEMYRVLRKGGYVLLSAPQIHSLHEEPHDYYRYTCYGLKSIFERAGFTVVHYEQVGGFYTVITHTAMAYIKNRFNLRERWWLRGVSFVFRKWGEFSLWLDEKDDHPANRTNTTGWVFVLRK
jgi:SAM-dependent methyltransferase